MSTASAPQRRAFAVMFSALHRWSVGSFIQTEWHWPEAVIKPLSLVLRRKVVEVDRSKMAFGALGLVTLHFDGEMEPRDLAGKNDFKGKLFFADPGDVIYSKIDVRNGAIGVVPLQMHRIAVSSEYPVYSVEQDLADAQYIKLLFRTSGFRRKLNSMISGASGRKRVQPTELEEIEVPLPPLPIQRAIVAHWHKAQAAGGESLQRADKLQAEINARFLRDLGLKPPDETASPKVFAVPWAELRSWAVWATVRLLAQGALEQCKYPVVHGTDCLHEIKHGCSASPAKTNTKLRVLKISAVTKGHLRLDEAKYAVDRHRFRRDFDLKSGDVLMCRTNGTLGLVGMAALVDKEVRDMIFPDKVIRVRTKANLLPEFLWHVLKTSPLRAQIEAAARTAVGNYAIGTEDIWRLRIPLPPLPVQGEIMKRVREVSAQVEGLRLAAREKERQVNAEVEELILGTKELPEQRSAIASA